MTSISIVLSLFLLYISYVDATNFAVVYKRCKGDTDVIKMDSATITCDGSDYCTWGSVGQVSGVFTIVSDLSSSTSDIVTRGFGYSKNKYGEVDICDYVNSSLDGAKCPAAGTYSFSTEVTFPESVKDNWYMSFIVNKFRKYEIKFDFEGDDASVKCFFRIFTEDNKRYKNNVNAGALLFVGAAATAFGITKRRRIATGSEDLLGRGAISSDFEMMDTKGQAACMY